MNKLLDDWIQSKLTPDLNKFEIGDRLPWRSFDGMLLKVQKKDHKHIIIDYYSPETEDYQGWLGFTFDGKLRYSQSINNDKINFSKVF